MKTMRNCAFLALLLLVTISCKKTQDNEGELGFYQTELFKAVHETDIFTDSKSFVDLTPVSDPMELNDKYLRMKEQEGFSLEDFVAEHFTDTWKPAPVQVSDTSLSMYEHLENLWDALSRPADERELHSSRIPLPYPYVVPGGRFREIYYWDSYFTMEGLRVSKRDELFGHMLKNFAFLLDSIGFIPNGTRTYYETRSQPPFFSLMVETGALENEEIYQQYLPALEKEYTYWMERGDRTADPEALRTVQWDSVLVNRYYDVSYLPRFESYREDVELASQLGAADKRTLYNHLRTAACSGWDFSSRWYSGDGLGSTVAADIIPVDLNSLMYHLELTLARAYELQGVDGLDEFLKYKELAETRKAFIQEQLWSESGGFYFDYNFRQGALTEELTLAGVYPLFFEIATEGQAEKVKDMVMNVFLKPGGLVTTLRNTGEQWDAPNGWAPLQWMAVKGLLNYGYESEAVEIMQRWLRLNNRVYKRTGKMMEKYNVENLELLSGGGEYPTQDGFGWTNGVALGFRELLIELDAEVPGYTQTAVYAE